MSAIGFIYWIIAARLYTPTEIGLATTFLSAASLVNAFAMLGLNNTLIRYLPTSDAKEKKINTAFTLVAITALIIGLIYIAGLSLWTEKLIFIRKSLSLVILTALFFPINMINGITDSVFTAFRESQWVFVSNISQSTVKLIALILLSGLGVWGVIGSNIVAITFASILCIILITYKYNIRFRPTVDRDILIKVQKFALGNYFSGLIGLLPTLLIPIIITNRLSPDQTAYFYMPNMISSMLAVIPSTISRSYLTESSYIDRPISMKKPLLITYLILIPIVIVSVLFGKNILSLFGQNYSGEGYTYFVLITFSILISVFNYFLSTKYIIQKQISVVIALNTIGSTLYVLLVMLLISTGIAGIGLATIITHIVSTILYILIPYFKAVK